MGQKGKKKNRSWKRKLGLERLLLPEYQRDDGGLNVKLCSPRSSRANQDGGTRERLRASGSIKPGVYVLALDGCVLHSAASQGAPIPSRGWMRSDGWSGQSRLGERTGILSMQLRRRSNPNPFQASCVATGRVSPASRRFSVT